MTRRSLMKSLGVSVLGGALLRPARAAVRSPLRRDYRADAVILLFSIPIYTREGVGSGYASARVESEDSRRIESWQFAAGSDPSRAKGLNRLGYIQETVTQEAGGPPASVYTGFMTASEEQSLSQAKSALESNAGEKLQYMGIEGEIDALEARSRSVRFETPASWNWTNFHELFVFAERVMRETSSSREVVLKSTGGPRSFLSAIMEAIADPRPKTERVFVYGSAQHSLYAEKRADAKMARRFAGRGLTKRPEQIEAIHGRLQEIKGNRNSKFRIWYERGSDNPLPLRIEFQPKSFLSLAFEARQAG